MNEKKKSKHSSNYAAAQLYGTKQSTKITETLDTMKRFVCTMMLVTSFHSSFFSYSRYLNELVCIDSFLLSVILILASIFLLLILFSYTFIERYFFTLIFKYTRNDVHFLSAQRPIQVTLPHIILSSSLIFSLFLEFFFLSSAYFSFTVSTIFLSMKIYRINHRVQH